MEVAVSETHMYLALCARHYCIDFTCAIWFNPYNIICEVEMIIYIYIYIYVYIYIYQGDSEQLNDYGNGHI